MLTKLQRDQSYRAIQELYQEPSTIEELSKEVYRLKERIAALESNKCSKLVSFGHTNISKN